MVSKDSKCFRVSFDTYEKFVAYCPLSGPPTQKLKSGFLTSSSQGIASSLVLFEMIFEALQSELFRFKFHAPSLKILKIPEFNLPIYGDITYTQCTLKLRPVKLLFVIFGRLSYSFFVHLMVWGNGRLSYLILKNNQFFIEKWPIFDRFLTRGGLNGLYYDFLSIRLTKDCIKNFRETYFRKNEW